MGDIVKKALPKEGGLEKDKKGRMPYRRLSIEGAFKPPVQKPSASNLLKVIQIISQTKAI